MACLLFCSGLYTLCVQQIIIPSICFVRHSMGSMGGGMWYMGSDRVRGEGAGRSARYRPKSPHQNPPEPIRTHVKRIACPIIPSRAQQYAHPVLGLFGDYLRKKRKSCPFIPKFDFLFISLYLYLLSCRSACRCTLEYRGWRSGWKWSPQGLRKDEDRADMPNTDTLITLKTLQK